VHDVTLKRLIAIVIFAPFIALTACSNSIHNETVSAITGGVVLPLSVGKSKSDLRATITTSIGGQSQKMLFDTGSIGLSVFSTSVPTSIASMSGDPFQEPFSGGVILNGVLVSIPMEIAGATTNGPVMVRLVQSVACEDSSADCAAKDGLRKFSDSIGADGIFGAGLWSSGSLFTPLLQLDSEPPDSVAVTWNGSAGSVTLNPTVSGPPIASLQMPVASPATLPNGTNAWNNLSVPMCWRIGDSEDTCTPTALDSGASALSFPIGFPGGPTTDVKRFSSGQRIYASVAENSQPFLSITSGRTLGKDLATVIPGQGFVDTGVQFFREFLVVFSLSTGVVSLYS